MINLSKLTKMVQKDGKIEAQCPACAASGADATGNHLVIFPDGKFGCVANPEDKEHNKAILKLVGDRSAPKPANLTIRRQTIPESSVVMKIGRIGRVKSTPAETSAQTDAPPSPSEADEMGPCSPGTDEGEIFPPPPTGGWTTLEGVTPEEFRRRWGTAER